MTYDILEYLNNDIGMLEYLNNDINMPEYSNMHLAAFDSGT